MAKFHPAIITPILVSIAVLVLVTGVGLRPVQAQSLQSTPDPSPRPTKTPTPRPTKTTPEPTGLARPTDLPTITPTPLPPTATPIPTVPSTPAPRPTKTAQPTNTAQPTGTPIPPSNTPAPVVATLRPTSPVLATATPASRRTPPLEGTISASLGLETIVAVPSTRQPTHTPRPRSTSTPQPTLTSNPTSVPSPTPTQTRTAPSPSATPGRNPVATGKGLWPSPLGYAPLGLLLLLVAVALVLVRTRSGKGPARQLIGDRPRPVTGKDPGENLARKSPRPGSSSKGSLFGQIYSVFKARFSAKPGAATVCPTPSAKVDVGLVLSSRLQDILEEWGLQSRLLYACSSRKKVELVLAPALGEGPALQQLAPVLEDDLDRRVQVLPGQLVRLLTKADPLDCSLHRPIAPLGATKKGNLYLSLPGLAHLGIAGEGSLDGLHGLLSGLIQVFPPDKLRFVIVDPGRRVADLYEGLPHLLELSLADVYEETMERLFLRQRGEAVSHRPDIVVVAVYPGPSELEILAELVAMERLGLHLVVLADPEMLLSLHLPALVVFHLDPGGSHQLIGLDLASSLQEGEFIFSYRGHHLSGWQQHLSEEQIRDDVEMAAGSFGCRQDLPLAASSAVGSQLPGPVAGKGAVPTGRANLVPGEPRPGRDGSAAGAQSSDLAIIVQAALELGRFSVHDVYAMVRERGIRQRQVGQVGQLLDQHGLLRQEGRRRIVTFDSVTTALEVLQLDSHTLGGKA